MISNQQHENKEVWLVQTGGHSKQCIDIFLENGYTIKGCFDNWCTGSFYRDCKIIDTIEQMHNYVKESDPIFCTIGDNQKRKQLVGQYPHHNWINCISKHSYISPSVQMGRGNYIGVGTKLLADTKIGHFNICNDGSTLTHDNNVSDFNHFAPNCSLGGKVIISNNCLIATNATINPNVFICDQVVVGSGAVVTKDIKKTGVYVGIPAKKH
jgi:sugar O-acyltransferase (sialic acid O-acetyltransferase NeuD family)